MRIARVEYFLVPPRWLFVRVETNSGVVGWGEASLEGHGEAVAGAISAFEDVLVGQDARRIEWIWQTLATAGFYRGGAVLGSAVSGIDQALWDINGRQLGVPVHQLLGGHVRDRIRVYGWVGGDDPSGIREAVRAQRERGLTAVKMNASGPVDLIGTSTDTDGIVERLAAARETIGADGDVALDFHGRISPGYARRLLPYLEPFHPLFIEEPVLPEHGPEALARLVDGTSIPIAVGERLYHRTEMLPALKAGVAVLQPDLSHAHGISETVRIASLADTFGAAIAPHCPLGPLALASALQVDFATRNVLIQEQSIGIHYNKGSNELLDYVLNPEVFAISDGYMQRPTGAGLGVEINETLVRELGAHPHRWRTPLWTRKDGASAEW